MAIGSSVITHSSVANSAVLTIQPTAGAVWVIQNLYMGGAWEIHRTDGTNDITIMAGVTADSIQNRDMLVSNTIYLTLKNVSGGAIYMGYDGYVIA
jgi:hypothetical protein